MPRHRGADSGDEPHVHEEEHPQEEPHDHEEEHPQEKDDKEEPRPPGRDPDADPVKVHRDYVERHLGGGAPATPEAYARALKQWHELPGAVGTPPTEVAGEEAEKPPADEENPPQTQEPIS
jgi:hypothetical protein